MSVIAVIVLGLLARAATNEFITGTLIDNRLDTTPDQLISVGPITAQLGTATRPAFGHGKAGSSARA